MALLDTQIIDCRRFCGYEAFGQTVTPASGYRFFTHYGVLEYKMANLTPNETTTVQTMLANLNTLEAAIYGSSANLDTDQAAIWKHNKNEVQDRVKLYKWARNELCRFFGVPPGPGLGASGAMVV